MWYSSTCIVQPLGVVMSEDSGFKLGFSLARWVLAFLLILAGLLFMANSYFESQIRNPILREVDRVENVGSAQYGRLKERLIRIEGLLNERQSK